MRTYTVGTRGSALALWQTRHVTSLLKAHAPHIAERVITTRGDVNLTERLQGSLEKGFFTEELEAALHQKEIDWAVHSLKDLPTRNPKGLAIGAVLPRAPSGDLLLVREEAYQERSPNTLPLIAGARIGSSSLRREALIDHFADFARSTPLRGNVPTRVEKLRQGQFDAVLLAEAGVTRLGLDLSGLRVFRLNPRRWVCAPGQGAVAVQCRDDDAEILALLKHLDHPATRHATSLERDFLRILEGGCTTPFGAFVDEGRAFLAQQTDKGFRSGSCEIPQTSPQPAWLQQQLDALASNTSEEKSNEWLTRRV